MKLVQRTNPLIFILVAAGKHCTDKKQKETLTKSRKMKE